MDTVGFLADSAKCAEEMEQLLKNYKKEGKRKTKESTQRRLVRLDEKWKRFHENHLQLEQNLDPTDEYLKKDFYGATKKVYIEAKILMEKFLKGLAPGETIHLESNPSTSSSSDEDERDESQAHAPKRGDEQSTGAYPKWPDNPLRDFPTNLIQEKQPALEPLRLWGLTGSQDISGRDEVSWGGLTSKPRPGTEMPHGGSSGKHAPSFHTRSESRARNEIPPLKQSFQGDRSKRDAPPQANLGQNAGCFEQGPGYYFIPYGQHSEPVANSAPFNTSFNWSHAPHRPKLQPLKIGKFTGKSTEWRGFYELFRRIIHNDPQLDDIEKFSYLLSYLDGDAKKIVNHLSPTSDHYAAALELLKNWRLKGRNV